ncbi:MAG: terpene cyclase/mutase family protein [Candidatus Atribacteria bacterium]|nr:terpene cyclase/mutase family protein [Candidatus Atribacteria bacterium]
MIREKRNIRKKFITIFLSLSIVIFAFIFLSPGIPLPNYNFKIPSNFACLAWAESGDSGKDQKEQEAIKEAIILATDWLLSKQRSDGSWPIITKDKNPCLVATGLYGLETINKLLSLDWLDGDFVDLLLLSRGRAINFILSSQKDEGYWESLSFIPWNKVEVTTTALSGLVSCFANSDYPDYPEAQRETQVRVQMQIQPQTQPQTQTQPQIQSSTQTQMQTQIQKGINWLLEQQKENGSWSDDCWDTIWALRLFLDYGYNPDDPVVKKAGSWLIEDQKKSGSWKTDLSHLDQFGSLWTTQPAIFTLAKTGQYQDSLSKGLKYLRKEQNRSGSFGHSDAAKTGMALLAFCSLDKYPDLKEEYKDCAEEAVEWFLEKQKSKGTWPGGFHPFDIVDTSLALWGLIEYLQSVCNF